MSNFKCPKCHKDILEDHDGNYITGCEHYPLELTRKELEPINCHDRKQGLTDLFGCEIVPVQITSKERMDEIDRLASRHIAKCLDHLGETMAPIQKASIKRSFRYFADDVKQVMQGESHDSDESIGNR